MEFNDIYDKDRNLTGRTHRRGTIWRKGEYGLVVCVWIYDGKGKLLLPQEGVCLFLYLIVNFFDQRTA